MSRVVVLPVREVTGWTGVNDSEVLTYPVMDIKEALVAQFESDAHFCPLLVSEGGVVPSELPRINQSALSTLEESKARVIYEVICADVDHPGAHDPTLDITEAPNLWWEEQKELFKQIPICRNVGYYRTKRGYRLLWMLREPLGIEDYLETLGLLRHTLEQSGISADHLHDYNRLYRLPLVKRDGRSQSYEMSIEGLGFLSTGDLVKPPVMQTAFAGIANVPKGRAPLQDRIKGNRNLSLTSMGGVLRYRGFNEVEILAMLLVVNQQRCDPPMKDDEVAKIAKSVARYESGQEKAQAAAAALQIPSRTKVGSFEDIKSRPAVLMLGSEIEMADWVLNTLEDGGANPVVFDRGALHQYCADSGIWKSLQNDEVRKASHALDGIPVAVGTDKNGSPKVKPLRMSYQISDSIRKIACDRRVCGGFFDDQKRGVSFRNGFFSPSEGLLPHSPEHRSTFSINANFQRGVRPERFIKFLTECFSYNLDCLDRIELLREFFGILICGYSPVFEQALIMPGTGSNGKSTLLKTIAKIFPPEAVTAVPPQDLALAYNRARLLTSRLNVVTEMPEADILASEPFKAFISGDVVEAAHKYGHPFKFRPRGGHVFAANALPGVRDTTHGFYRRWIVMPWDREFGEEDKDPYLEHKLADEIDEIACWMVEGALNAIVRGKYMKVASCEKAKRGWQQLADPLVLFLDQNTEPAGQREGLDLESLHAAYRTWCRRVGHQPLALASFSRRLKLAGGMGARTAAGKLKNFKLLSSFNR